MLSKWSLKRLVGAWVAYWVGLAAVFAGPTLLELLRLRMSDQHGQVSLSYEGGLTEAALWLAGPPLLMAIVWIATRPRRDAAPGSLAGGESRAPLAAPAPPDATAVRREPEPVPRRTPTT